ncbi:hypothetical protein AGOR_G00077710 [Albula goreensis]|uniref:Uncharacterized protein n=1 Tax=Albula goreensis TaxID=1534307 RepID=A0A8T3DXD4_9TELE|nr:hypothetical protein AGOR_G00077710 [Albula goreensis]
MLPKSQHNRTGPVIEDSNVNIALPFQPLFYFTLRLFLLSSHWSKNVYFPIIQHAFSDPDTHLLPTASYRNALVQEWL